ncbi:MAG: hypothetical protein ABIP06_08485 [Pyrinomonadaceae bacterium]
MKYKTISEITNIVKSFESAAISRDDWRHVEHLVVANHYLSENDFDTAYAKMREGIFNLLRSFEVDLKKEMPYHETLTIFWLRTVDSFRKLKNGCSVVEICNGLAENFDKDLPLKFYSRELLFSSEARAKFVEADLQNSPAFSKQIS